MNYEMSARRVAQRLDIELEDIDGFSCCGFPAKPLDWQAGLLMAAVTWPWPKRGGSTS
jgi:heterodisulfide reductase subunit B